MRKFFFADQNKKIILKELADKIGKLWITKRKKKTDKIIIQKEAEGMGTIKLELISNK